MNSPNGPIVETTPLVSMFKILGAKRAPEAEKSVKSRNINVRREATGSSSGWYPANLSHAGNGFSDRRRLRCRFTPLVDEHYRAAGWPKSRLSVEVRSPHSR